MTVPKGIKRLVERFRENRDWQADWPTRLQLYGLTDEEIASLRRTRVRVKSRGILNILQDDRNGVDTRRVSTYYVAELHNYHC